MARYLGLDLGGTNIKAGIVDEEGKRVLAQGSWPTRVDEGVDAVIDALAAAAREVAGRAGVAIEEVRAVGVGSPGMLDFERGLVRAAPNLPRWRDVPLRDRLAEALGRPAVLENDANAAAFGEFWAGAGGDESIRHMVMLTLGTGIGSGVIVDGRLVHGAHGMAAEAGHVIVVPGGRLCGCGQRGCVEAYASAANTARRAAEAIEAGEDSVLRARTGGGGDTMTAKDVFDAAKAGDALAARIVEETATFLGIVCVNLCRVLDPQMIVFAGGMILAGDILFEAVREAFREHAWKLVDSPVEIVPAALGNDAGFIGAAAVAWDADRGGRLRR